MYKIFQKGNTVTNKRHSITNVIQGQDNYLVGECRACDAIVRVYRTGEYILKDGTVMAQHRCANQLKTYAYRRNNLKHKRAIREEKTEAIKAIPSSLAAYITEWEEIQGGHCALCTEYVRKGRGKGRELFVVHDNQGSAIKGLFCWDCRNLINQRLTGKMEKSITHILKQDRLRLTPPPSAGR